MYSNVMMLLEKLSPLTKMLNSTGATSLLNCLLLLVYGGDTQLISLSDITSASTVDPPNAHVRSIPVLYNTQSS